MLSPLRRALESPAQVHGLVGRRLVHTFSQQIFGVSAAAAAGLAAELPVPTHEALTGAHDLGRFAAVQRVAQRLRLHPAAQQLRLCLERRRQSLGDAGPDVEPGVVGAQ
eukprot:1150075-Rhodomonas_salina.1